MVLHDSNTELLCLCINLENICWSVCYLHMWRTVHLIHFTLGRSQGPKEVQSKHRELNLVQFGQVRYR